MDTTVNTVQEAHQAIAEAVMEKTMKARWPGCPIGSQRALLPSAGAYNVDDWM